MKIIVTGGAGFIASHIADRYIKDGNRVIIIDNLSAGFRKNINPRAKFYKADIRNLSQIKRIFKKERPEIVNHHAAIAEVIKSVRNPIPTFETNVLGTANVSLAFGNFGVGKRKKFIFSSSGGAIYGDPKKIPADESTEIAPVSPYGLSKFLGEEIIKFYSREFGFKYLILRYANVYGPRQNPKGEAGVVAIFGRLIKIGIRPKIFGDGTKARDYVYIDDIVRANTLGLKRGGNEILNIGLERKISDRKIFDTIAKLLHYSDTPIHAPYRKGEIYQISLNARRAGKILDWRPRISLEDGIKKTLG